MFVETCRWHVFMRDALLSHFPEDAPVGRLYDIAISPDTRSSFLFEISILFCINVVMVFSSDVLLMSAAPIMRLSLRIKWPYECVSSGIRSFNSLPSPLFTSPTKAIESPNPLHV